VESSGEDSRATGGLVYNVTRPRINKTKNTVAWQKRHKNVEKCLPSACPSLRLANMQYMQVRQRVGGARYMCADETLHFVLQVRGRAPVFVYTCDCLPYIYIQSASMHTMVPVHISYVYSLSAFYL